MELCPQSHAVPGSHGKRWCGEGLSCSSCNGSIMFHRSASWLRAFFRPLMFLFFSNYISNNSPKEAMLEGLRMFAMIFCIVFCGLG